MNTSADANSSKTALCTGRIWATYPAPHLTLATGFLDQVCAVVIICYCCQSGASIVWYPSGQHFVAAIVIL